MFDTNDHKGSINTVGSWHWVPSTSNSHRWWSERRRCSIYGISGRTRFSSIVKCILRMLLVVVTQSSTLAATLLSLACLRLVHTIPNSTCLMVAFAFLAGWIRNISLKLIILNERSHYSNPVYLMSPGAYSCLLAKVRWNKYSWLQPRLCTCRNDVRAWQMQ